MANQYTDGWTQAQDDLLKEKANIMSAKEIGYILSRTQGAVYIRASKLGIRLISPRRRRYSLNSRFFAEPNSTNVYWLGALWADGHVSREGITLMISDRDKEWTRALAIALDSNAPLRFVESKNAVRFTAYSVTLVSDLQKYNLFPGNRVESPMTPVNIPDMFVNHFVRGLFDGDGSCGKGNRGSGRVEITNSPLLCDWVFNITQKTIGVGGGVYNRKSPNTSDWVLCGRRQVQRFVDWIYEDANYFLPRKAEKFHSLGFYLTSTKHCQ